MRNRNREITFSIFIGFVILISLVLGACDSPTTEDLAPPTPVGITQMVTRDVNCKLDFIQFAVGDKHPNGLPGKEIGDFVNSSIRNWEAENPTRHLQSFQIVYQTTAYMNASYTEGMWILGCPKLSCPK